MKPVHIFYGALLSLVLGTTSAQSNANNSDVALANDSSICANLYNLYNPCSGNGVCLSDGSCKCNTDFSGRSDWFNRDGLDCQINEKAILGLWATQLIFIVAVGFIGWPKMYTLFQRYLITRRRMAGQGRKYPVTKNQALVSMMVYWGLCWPSHVCLCAYKVAVPSDKIGVDMVPTMLWFLERSFFYFVGYLFQPALIKSLMHGRKDALSYLTKRRVTYTWRTICFGMILSGVLSIVAATVTETENGAEITLVLFNALMVTFLVGLASYSRVVNGHVARILDESHSVMQDGKLLTVKDNLLKIQSEVTRQTSLQIPIYLLFGAFPYLWDKHDYLYPISITVMPVIGFRGIKSLMDNSNATSGLRSGSMAPSSMSRSRKATGDEGTLSSHANSNAMRPSRADQIPDVKV